MKKCLLLFFLFHISLAFSQNPVNGYGNITAISSNTLTLNSVTETYDTFEDGEYVIVMQMQDDAIGTNTTNAVSFGNIGSMQSAGLFEVAIISSHTEVSGLPNTVVLTGNLANTYHIGANASVQLISYPTLGSPNYSTSGNITTAAWNGTVGGVTALYVNGTLTLNNSITANGAGFRGGTKNTPNGYSACDNTTYMTAIAQRYAGKGESIYKITNTAFTGARGKILNGGGGGNDVNAGGGGGGNYSAGGDGGAGWVPAGTGCNPVAAGLGGLSLSASINPSRVFLGGGGGAGHENDGVGTAGGAGGGIILIKAKVLQTNACTGVSITANGITPPNALNDGSGGGGAGGSIVFQVNTFSVTGGCPLTISSSGGGGGFSNTAGSVHGGGGGGGQGAVVFSMPQPTANVTTSTAPGAGGLSCVGCTGTVSGSVGGGPANSGIIPNSTGVLPIELLNFSAQLNPDLSVLVYWRTAVELNNGGFVLERMNMAGDVMALTTVTPKGNNSHYEFTDLEPGQGENYYRLRQTDNDGSVHYTAWVSVLVEKSWDNLVEIYPNPLGSPSLLTFKFSHLNGTQAAIQLRELSSGLILDKQVEISESSQSYMMPVPGLANGTYVVQIAIGDRIIHKKLVVLK